MSLRKLSALFQPFHLATLRQAGLLVLCVVTLSLSSCLSFRSGRTPTPDVGRDATFSARATDRVVQTLGLSTIPPAGSTPTAAESSATATLSWPRQMVVTADPACNVRSGPSEQAQIITTLPLNTIVEVVECSGEWCKVRHAKVPDPAYIHITLLMDIGAAPRTPKP